MAYLLSFTNLNYALQDLRSTVNLEDPSLVSSLYTLLLGSQPADQSDHRGPPSPMVQIALMGQLSRSRAAVNDFPMLCATAIRQVE